MDKIRPQDLDWASLWQQANHNKPSQKKQATDWDQKAASFATRTVHSVYTEKFLALLAPQPGWSILDVGCGPGTLAIPLAQQVQQVCAIDFSANMLSILKKRAKAKGLNNICCHQLAWEDDWAAHGVQPHDVAIASRSMAVTDLKDALLRLNAFATKRVCITDRVKFGPKDPDAFAAIGRKKATTPDYIYTVNLLYQLGLLPTVNYIKLEGTLHYKDFNEALASYTWMFKDLSPTEKHHLKQYVDSIATRHKDNSITLHRRHVPTWAFISWEPTPDLPSPIRYKANAITRRAMSTKKSHRTQIQF